MSGDRSVSIGGGVSGSAIVTGDQNTVSVTYTKTTLPPAESVDMRSELAELRKALAALQSPDAGKIQRALDDAEEEAAKPEPDKDEIGAALERAIGYAEKADGFAQAVEKLAPHVKNAAAWLGKNWSKILAFVGLAI